MENNDLKRNYIKKYLSWIPDIIQSTYWYQSTRKSLNVSDDFIGTGISISDINLNDNNEISFSLKEFCQEGGDFIANFIWKRKERQLLIQKPNTIFEEIQYDHKYDTL